MTNSVWEFGVIQHLPDEGRKGIAFIRADASTSGPDVFMHRSVYASGPWHDVRVGLRVAFKPATRPKGRYATEVVKA